MIVSRRCRLAPLALLGVFLLSLSARADSYSPVDLLAEGLRPFLGPLSGKQTEFELTGELSVKLNGTTESVSLRVARYDQDSFDLELIHRSYAVKLRRRPDATSFALPKHQVVFLATGPPPAADHLGPTQIVSRLVSPASTVFLYAPFLNSDPRAVAVLLTALLQVQFDQENDRWKSGGIWFRFGADQPTLELFGRGVRLQLQSDELVRQPAAADEWPGMRVVPIGRDELEQHLVRGFRRALEILAPSYQLTSPKHQDKRVAHGALRWIDGQRVVLLQGTPEQIGRAHGSLLKNEAQRCIDSVLYTFGTVETIRSGRWFAGDLASAYARLAPFIPEDHKLETRSLGDSLGLKKGLAETLNVFPELFHCSGFAVLGRATKGGKLYHGRVLDYMTTIGLQDAATTFVVAVDGKVPFVTVGYAGFTGSVSGMNASGISLGEMGGRGEGKWDGVPMATLMRLALEQCGTLDEVMELWRNSPRTCEYYYVFADGNSNRAVGVAADPDSIEFVLPGQAHPRLGPGIQDSVVLSAGRRLTELRQRVIDNHGKIDAEIAKGLMARPVAMQSNLHNVLFVPQDLVLYVANADHKHPAAERPYVKLRLLELLASFPGQSEPPAEPK